MPHLKAEWKVRLNVALPEESWLLSRTNQPSLNFSFSQISKVFLNSKSCTLKWCTGCGGRHTQVAELKQLICLLMVLCVTYRLTGKPSLHTPKGHLSSVVTGLSFGLSVCNSLSHHTNKVVSTLLFMDEKSTHVKLASHVEFCFSQWNYGGLASTLFPREIP